MPPSADFGCSIRVILLSVVTLAHFCSGHVNPLLPREVQRHIESRLEAVFFRELPFNLTQPVFSPKILIENLVPFFLRDVVGSTTSERIVEQVGINLKAQETKPKCLEDLTELLMEVLVRANQSLPATWALHMIDSWGKIPSGIFSGNVMAPGDFVECINLKGSYMARERGEVSSVGGKYCATYVIPGPNFEPWLKNGSVVVKQDEVPSTGDRITVSLAGLLDRMLDFDRVMILPFMGTCFPASCTLEDVQTTLTTLYDMATSGIVTQVALGCATDEKPPFRNGHYVMIIGLAVIISLCIFGTVADIEHSGHQRRSDSAAVEPAFLVRILLSFSLYTNTKKWLSTHRSSDNLGCLHGLRTLSMAWIILAHTWCMLGFQFNWNMIGVVEWYRNWSYLPILNATVSVDTFFTMSGALLSYNLLRELDRTKGCLNYPMLVLHRYLRITPTYVIIVGMMATLLPYVGTGPQWYAIEMESKNCEEHWWHNILYINNLVDYSGGETGECYAESWYLANDMQFFLLAPLVVYPLWRWRRLGYFLLTALSMASMMSPAYIMERKRLDPTLSPFSNVYPTYMSDIYTKPWTRCGPYVAGMILGYVLYLRSKNPVQFQVIPKRTVFWGWALSTVTALTIIYAPFAYFDPDNAEMAHTSWHSFLYGGVHRYAWGLIISWIIFACVNGNAGPVNAFLSWKAFMPLGRLTFCMYISSYHLQITYHMSQVLHPVHVSAYSVVYLFLAHFVAAAFVGYVLMITLESPFIQLEKLLLEGSRSRPKRVHFQSNESNGGWNETKEFSTKEKITTCKVTPRFGRGSHRFTEVAGIGDVSVVVTSARGHAII